MPATAIPSSHADLFQKKAFAHLATLMPDGQPQVTPVWVEFDGRHVIINTAEGRQKDKNLQRDKRVALSRIDAMAKKYLGKDKYPFRQPNEVRVIYKIEPLHATSMG
jgi:predicted pyridoxine 5'-phosphate oxidase superfamily flavin-nucleotide-binding protein